MTTSIFIKTCYKDHIWLQYLCPSIEKYAEGFESVVIVSDDGHIIPEEYINIIKKIKVYIYYVPLPTVYPDGIKYGIGYLWQQYIKLNWTKYCSSDAVLMLDSDEMLIKTTTPNIFKYNDKWIWTYRPWDKAGHCDVWKKSTDNMLKINTSYEAMCFNPWGVAYVLLRTETEELMKYLLEVHSITDLWDLINRDKITELSEYNVYGSFIHHVDNNLYYFNIIEDNDKAVKDRYIIANWSWGGITTDIHNKNISYL